MRLAKWAGSGRLKRDPDAVRRPRRSARLRVLTVAGAGVALSSAILVGTAGGAAAGPTLPADLAEYANCPVSNPDVSSCIYVKTTNTQLKLGGENLTSTDPITLEFGIKFDPDTFAPTVVAPTNGHNILTGSPIALPGGLLNIPGTGVGPLAVYATPELTALPTVNLTALRSRKGVAFGLNLRAHIDNPFLNVLSLLGPGCYIGSASDPIALNLTTGTTNPPGPNTPISGTFNNATQVGQPVGGLLFPNEVTVDNAFRAPGAHGCGLGWGPIDWIVDLDAGLPSSAGTNSASLTSNIYQVDANVVRQALGMPTV